MGKNNKHKTYNILTVTAQAFSKTKKGKFSSIFVVVTISTMFFYIIDSKIPLHRFYTG